MVGGSPIIDHNKNISVLPPSHICNGKYPILTKIAKLNIKSLRVLNLDGHQTQIIEATSVPSCLDSSFIYISSEIIKRKCCKNTRKSWLYICWHQLKTFYLTACLGIFWWHRYTLFFIILHNHIMALFNSAFWIQVIF